MRIVFTVPNYRPRITGPGTVVEKVVDRVRRAGHECLVLTRARPDAAAGTQGPVERLATPRANGHPTAKQVSRALKRFGPDVVFVHEMRNRMTEAASRWALAKGVRLAVQPHGEWAAYTRLPSWWQRATFRGYDLVHRASRDPRAEFVATSALEEAELRASLGPKPKIVRLYLGADIRPRNASPRGPGPARILMLANFGVFRDPRPVAAAVRRLNDAHGGAELVLAGAFAPHSVLTRNLAPPKEATYLGKVDEAGRDDALRTADLFCYPSRYESFALPILEAACAGVPVVASSVGIAPEIGVAKMPPHPSVEEIHGALSAALSELDALRSEATRAAGALSAWSRWDVRADAYRAWLEGGDAPDDLPPAVGPITRAR